MNIPCNKCGNSFEPLQDETTCHWCLAGQNDQTVRLGNQFFQEHIVNFVPPDNQPDMKATLIKAWAPTPFMIDVELKDQETAMMLWCRNHFGFENGFRHSELGIWRRAYVTLRGRSWFGFATENLLNQFKRQFNLP